MQFYCFLNFFLEYHKSRYFEASCDCIKLINSFLLFLDKFSRPIKIDAFPPTFNTKMNFLHEKCAVIQLKCFSFVASLKNIVARKKYCCFMIFLSFFFFFSLCQLEYYFEIFFDIVIFALWKYFIADENDELIFIEFL